MPPTLAECTGDTLAKELLHHVHKAEGDQAVHAAHNPDNAHA